MKNTNLIQHPVIHNGSSQYERLLESILPENLKLDDRSIQDLIVHTFEYSKLIRYYDENNQPDGDWSCFWEIEALTFLATLAALDLEEVQAGYVSLEIAFAQALDAYLDPANTNCTVEPSQEYFQKLLNYLYNMAAQIERYYQLLPDANPLKSEILVLIQKDSFKDAEHLVQVLYDLIGFHKYGFDTLDHTQFQIFFSNRWGLKDQEAYDCIIPDGDFDREILRKLFLTLYQTLIKIKQRAQQIFDKELETPTIHQPHVALYLTFLYLFKHAQNSLNGLTEKHLNHYYEKILCLKRRAETPDEVHIIIGLAQNVNDYLIEKGTELLADKDENGKPRIYEVIEDWVVNKTQVAEIKNTFLDLENTGNVFSAEIANSEDGTGEAFADPSNPRWRGMGDDIRLPKSEIGFALASPQLILKEGVRMILAEFDFAGDNFADSSETNVQLDLSTEEGWESVSAINFENEISQNGTGFFLSYIQPRIDIAEFEGLSRIISALSTDIGSYLVPPQGKGHPTLKEVYDRNSTDSIDFISDKLYHTAYKSIEEINQAIDLFIPQVEASISSRNIGFDTIIKYLNLGELYLYRAYFYWNLAQVYAPPLGEGNPSSNLPVKLDEKKQESFGGGDIFLLDELYTLIEQDLLQAEEILPSLGLHSFITTRFVAKALLAKLYLARQNWVAAIEKSDEIINSGRYSLEQNPEDAFSFAEGKVSSEVLWCIDNCDPIKKGCPSIWDSFSWHDHTGGFSMERSVPASYAMLEGSLGEGWIEKGDDGNYQLTSAGEADQRFQSLFVRTGFNSRRDSQQEPIFDDQGNPRVWVNKFNRNTRQKVVLIRYAEILLNTCIAEIQIGNVDAALEKLNTIRNRAGLEALSSIDEGFILRERAFEFAFEGDRKFALQTLQVDIPAGDRDGGSPIPWNDPTMVLKSPDSVDNPKGKSLLNTKMSVLAVLREDFLPLAPIKDTKEALDTPWPAMKLIPYTNKAANGELPFQEASLRKVNLTVTALGIRENIILQNESGVSDPNQRFLPFGATPSKNDFFYIGSAEIFQKNLSFLQLDMNWVDSPKVPLYDHYAHYASQDNFGLDNVLPEILLEYLANGRFEKIGDPFPLSLPASDSDVVLFSTVALAESRSELRAFSLLSTEGLQTLFGQNLPGAEHLINRFRWKPEVQRDARIQEVTEFKSSMPRGFGKISLGKGDFLHDEYQNALLAAAIQGAKNNTETVPDASALPKAPYTPAINGLALSYTSRQEICIGPENDGIDHFFHILPFGYRKVSSKGTNLSLMPEFSIPTFNRGARELAKGNLYIGLSELVPGQSISLLVQVLEGSEKAPELLPPDINWSYLAAENTWIPFADPQILREETRGLTRSGLIQFSTAADMVKDSSLFPGELFWIRAAAQEESEMENQPAKSISALPYLSDIKAQALSLRFKNKQNELSHLGQSLPAQTISKLVRSRSSIKSIEQPYASFDGRLPEEGKEFYMRVSERLRHRDRAITLWDYERILLQAYPKVFRAKCINHTVGRLDKELAPSYVSVAVIPDLKNRNAVLREQPRFSFGDLEEMQDYLKSKCNGFVAAEDKDFLQVVNPQYEEIRIELQVAFYPGLDKNFYKFELDKDLRFFLSPWLSTQSVDITFGRPLHKSHILQFIEERPYVDGISYLEVYHFSEHLEPDSPIYDDCRIEGSYIRPLTARSILSTYLLAGKNPQDTDHDIRVVDTKIELCDQPEQTEPETIEC